jgi:hypothetical protein
MDLLRLETRAAFACFSFIYYSRPMIQFSSSKWSSTRFMFAFNFWVYRLLFPPWYLAGCRDFSLRRSE